LGKEGEEEATTAGATRQERCLEVPKNHHSRFVYTNPACLLTAKGASVDDAPYIAFVSRLSCINNNVRRPLLVVVHMQPNEFLTISVAVLRSQGLFFCAVPKHLPVTATLVTNSCFGTEGPSLRRLWSRSHSISPLRHSSVERAHSWYGGRDTLPRHRL
jgi:hypothetical protein